MQLDFLPEDTTLAMQRPSASPMKTTPTTPTDSESHDDEKAPSAFKTISEAATLLDVPQHVLRFWESKFPQIKPLKMRGGRRYYRPEDMEILTTIKHLLYKQGYTIKGAKKAISNRAAPLLERTVEAPKPVAATAMAVPVSVPVKTMNDKQQDQIAVIRQELIALRDALKPYVF